MSVKHKLAHYVFHLFYRRHLLYLDFLEASGDRYSRFFLTDCRDVFFQANPFAWRQSAGLHAFLEDASFKIQDCPHHVRWLSSLFDSKTLAKLGRKTISCAGTIFADGPSLRRYLERMISLAMRAKSLQEFDGDQGLHNFLVHERLIPNITIHENTHGPVLTLGRVSSSDLIFNSDGVIINKLGDVPLVLHQYDRIPMLREALLSRLSKTC
jgi:hypothetical protein